MTTVLWKKERVNSDGATVGFIALTGGLTRSNSGRREKGGMKTDPV